MPRRSEKVVNNRKKKNSAISQADRSIQFNKNACDQIQNNVTSHIESIGNLIINELKGSERDHLKQQLINSCISNISTNNNLPFSSSRRSLKQVLDHLHTFDYHNEQEYRTIGIGENDVNDDSEKSTIPQCKTRRTSFVDSSQTIDNEKKKIPNIITRTICTRSSKLNPSNNNQEQINHVLSNRARKRRQSLISDTNIQTPINNIDNTTEKSMGESVSDVKVSHNKLQSSVPCLTTVERLQTTNEF